MALKIKQDMQTHTTFSDGRNSITEMVKGAIAQGLKSIVISDHAKGWIIDCKNIEFFPTIEKYQYYLDQINKIKKTFGKDIKVLSALEIEIGLNGEMKLDKGISKYNDNNHSKKFGVNILIGSIHSESFAEDCEQFNIKESEKRKKLIENMCNLIKNRNLDVFAHPFQAIHGHFSKNLSAKETKKVLNTFKSEWKFGHNIYLEINGKKYPNYQQWGENKYSTGKMKINDANFIKKYKAIGGKFVLSSDAHSVRSLRDTDFSIFEDVEIKEQDIYMFYE